MPPHEEADVVAKHGCRNAQQNHPLDLQRRVLMRFKARQHQLSRQRQAGILAEQGDRNG
ncbi:MAG TPA: hypothetical protein VMB47_19705 [Candidatus Aquilonibacter sp.]|nr:hypothetical protein [Candidatus Aquilonibacter sp.]